MGDVNVITVTLARRQCCFRGRSSRPFRPPRLRRTASRAGHLVIRPEFLRFLATPSRGATTRSTARLYNEYALGSRIQYQVRVGDQVFMVEKLRQQALQRRPRPGGADRLGRQATPSW